MAVEGKLGTVRIAPQVLTTIAQLTALGTPGTVRMYRDLSSGVDRLLRGKHTADGVRIEVVDDAVNVDLYLVAAQDANLYELGREIQSRVSRAIKDMVGMPVLAVNVHIEDVDTAEADHAQWRGFRFASRGPHSMTRRIEQRPAPTKWTDAHHMEIQLLKIRRRARITALQVLFEVDSVHHDPEFALRERLEASPLPESGLEFCRALLTGVLAQQAALDAIIHQIASEWPIEQMAPIDRNILRLAAFEILCDEATPPKVVINEAVELAKIFGSDSSSRFVNGVLGTLLADKSALVARLAASGVTAGSGGGSAP